MITTIQITPETRQRLSALKSSRRETYDELLNKLLALVPQGDDEGRYTDGFRVGLLNARLDIQAGRVLDHERVKKQLGL
jgi:DNA-binding TFAR19-related protein (PDSD5 family)